MLAQAPALCIPHGRGTRFEQLTSKAILVLSHGESQFDRRSRRTLPVFAICGRLDLDCPDRAQVTESQSGIRSKTEDINEWFRHECLLSIRLNLGES